MSELLEFLDEKQRELEELESQAADLVGLEVQIPGKVPQELAASLIAYQKKITVLKRQIKRLTAQTRLAIAQARNSHLAGLDWRLNPLLPQYIEDLLTQLRAAVNYLQETNAKLSELVGRIYDYKIKLNFNSPAYFSERRW